MSKTTTFVHKKQWMLECEEQLQKAKQLAAAQREVVQDLKWMLSDMGDTWRDLKARVEALENQIKDLTQTP